MSDAERAERIFAGQILCFCGFAGAMALRDHADWLARAALPESSPVAAQTLLARDEYLDRVAALRGRFAADPRTVQLLNAALASVGVDLARCYRDRIGLRVLPYGDRHAGGRMATTHPHRDTWGSRLYTQINWWTPVYPLTVGRTIGFYPDYWKRPIANTSACWDYREYRDRLRDAPPGRAPDYPAAPEPAEAVAGPARRVIPKPGDLLCFSAAHLHVGVRNHTNQARFSVETRTVCADDIQAERTAPNVDGPPGPPMYRWFRGARDRAPLAGAVERPGVSVERK